MDTLSEITLKEIAQRLKQKKGNSEPPTLFLGSRTGWYYEHNKLYEDIQAFSNVTAAFKDYTYPQKFHELYTVLKGKRFNSGTIEDLLKAQLERPMKPRNADICLAEMICGGYFDVVISTTIDPLLQAGLNHHQSLVETEIFKNEVQILNISPLDDLLREERRVNKIIKIFGDLESRNYHTVQCELNLDCKKHDTLREYLRKVLARPTIIIGFDPVWDRPMVKAFSESGRDIIYINEDGLDEESDMARAIMKREGRWLIGPEWSYAGLMDILHEELFSQGGPLSYALARKLSEQLKVVQKNIADIQQKSNENGDRLEHVQQTLYTLRDDLQMVLEHVAWLQDSVQQLQNTQKLEKRKDS